MHANKEKENSQSVQMKHRKIGLKISLRDTPIKNKNVLKSSAFQMELLPHPNASPSILLRYLTTSNRTKNFP